MKLCGANKHRSRPAHDGLRVTKLVHLPREQEFGDAIVLLKAEHVLEDVANRHLTLSDQLRFSGLTSKQC